MKKRVWRVSVALVLAVVMILPFGSFGVARAAGSWHDAMPFRDVARQAWYYDAVHFAYENKWMNGTTMTTFSPDLTLTRGMVVTILWRLDGEPAARGSAEFSDVYSDMWYTDAVRWAAAREIVTGYSSTVFGPERSITREQMAAILYRYAVYKNYDTSASTNLSRYTDSRKTSAYAVEAMSWANAEGLITGMTRTTLAPQGNATRAEVATILMRFVERFVK